MPCEWCLRLRYLTENLTDFMAIRPIVLCSDPRIRAKNTPVTQFDATLKTLVQDMWDTLYSIENAIGLAANQIGINKQITVIDINRDQVTPLCLVNPAIISKQGEQYLEEGCLSVPGVQDTVLRASKISVRAQDVQGKTFEILDEEGLLAQCIQHEVDHLEGKLFVDHLSPIKKERALKKFEKYLRKLRQSYQT